jgi:acetyl esterase/lipase
MYNNIKYYGEAPMLHEKIYIDPSDERVFLETYALADPNVAARDAILILPGGAYRGISERERMYTPLAFLGKGINTFVLTYSIGADAVYPRQLLDACRALKYIKENAEKYHINPNRIFALGYSAGGHLLGLLTVHHDVGERELGLPKDYLKVRGSLFCYSAVSAWGSIKGRSFENLLKKPFADMTDEEKEFFSIEKNITSDSPPAFIWHTSEDKSVSISNSLKLCQAYYDAGQVVELHVFPYGPHGIALGTEFTSYNGDACIQPRAEIWVDEAFKWIKGLDR